MTSPRSGLPEETTGLACPECGAPLVLKPSRFGKFYGCSRWAETQCPGSHGAHPDGRPLGIPADRATKEARIRAHDAFDELWKGAERRNRARTAAYRWLAQEMGLAEVHIGALSIEECERVIRILEEKQSTFSYK